MEREGNRPEKIFLSTDISEKIWKIKLLHHYVLEKGWRKFTLFHDIKNEDTLLFTRTGKQSWSVEIVSPDNFKVGYHNGKSRSTPETIGESSRRRVRDEPNEAR